MFEQGNIIHGLFDFKENGKKNKFAVVLYKDQETCIITSFTTSQERASCPNPTHGKNPAAGDPRSYVFKAGVVIGTHPQTNRNFSFSRDTTIVPDYGIGDKTIEDFTKSVSNLKLICKLHPKEYIDLIYTLYHCKRISKKFKLIFEKILEELI